MRTLTEDSPSPMFVPNGKKIRAEAAALKTAEKRQKLCEINQRREETLNRINNQRQRQATIKERLQAKLKKRSEQKM